MTLKSSSFSVDKKTSTKSAEKRDALLKEHRRAIQKVLREAKTFSKDRKRALEEISDQQLRQSAAR